MDKDHIFDISSLSNEQIIELLRDIVSSQPGCGAMRTIKAKANEPLQKAIYQMTSFLDINEYSFVNLQTRTYMLLHGMQEQDFPRCIHCGKIVKKNVVSVHKGFINEACSMKCAAQSEQRHQKIAQTNLKNHGSEKWSNGEKISQSLKNMDPQRRAQTTMKFKKTRQKHIDENPDYWKDRDAKSRQTKLLRHGNPTWNNNQQISQTKQARAAEDSSYYQLQIEKGKQTKNERYGDPNWNNAEQTSKTKLERYGDPGWNNRLKAKQTCLEAYGVENVAQLSSTQSEIQQTCLEKYGSTCYFTSDIGKKTSQQTCLEKYGAKNFFESDIGKQALKLRHAKDTYEKVSCLSNEVEPLFTIDDVLHKTPLTMFKWRCKKCGNVFESPINFVNARCGGQFAQCLKCYPLKFKPTKQREVYDFVKSVYNDEVIMNDRTQIHPYEINIYLPQLKLGIEFDGMYWHSAYHGTPKNAMLYKTKLCKQKGITLFHVYEDEWDARKAQCKAYLAQTLSYKRSASINAFTIECIDKQQTQDFFDKNSYDLFAKASSWKNIAIVSNGKTLAAMALTKSNGKLLVGSYCNIAKKDSADFIGLLLKYARNEVAKAHSLHMVQLAVDNRQPMLDNIPHCFKFVYSTCPSQWLIDFSTSWRRCQKLSSKQALMPYGMQEDEDMHAFMHKRHITYIEDCGKLIFQAPTSVT